MALVQTNYKVLKGKDDFSEMHLCLSIVWTFLEILNEVNLFFVQAFIQQRTVEVLSL